MANSDKDILITPNNDADPKPEISFVGFNNAPIKLLVEDDNSLSFEGGAGQLYNIDNNLSANETFSVTDESGVPVLAYNVDGTVLLSPFSGSTSVGTKKSVSRFHVRPDGNAPVIALPDETNPRYSVGFGSVNVSNVGQRLDFYAGDSGDNETNLGSQQLRMSLTAEGKLGIATNNPGSMVDIRPISYAGNQASNGYQLGTTGGQWISRFFMRSDSNGVPFIGIETPADAEGNTVEAFQVQGGNAGYVRLRPGGDDNILNLSSERVGINKDISTGNDSRSVLEIDGGIRIRDTQGGESPSKPGHFGLWDSNINSVWKWISSTSYDTMNSSGVFRDVAYVDYKPLTTWRTNYLKYNTLVYRLNNVDNSSLNGLRLSPRMHNKEYTIASAVPGSGTIDNNTGVTTSGTPAVITLTEDISRIYGPFAVTNVTGWPTTAPTPDANGNYTTYNVYITLAQNANGEDHDYEFGTGIFLSGIGGGVDGGRSIFRIQGDRRLRIQINGSQWTGAATTSGGSCRGMWIRTAIRNAGTSTSQSVGWNWLRTYRFKTDATNPARTLTSSDNLASYQSVTSGYLRIYRDYSSSHYMYREQYDIGVSAQAMGWSDYCPTHTTFNYTQTGNNNNQQMACSYTGTGQAYRGHTYNLYGAYVPNLKGIDIYNRNYRNGRNNSQIGHYSEVRNGLENTSAGYTGFAAGFYTFMANRGTARTNDMRGIYCYLRSGENTSAHDSLVNNAYASWMYIRADGGTINNSYMYGGSYRTGSNNPSADPPTKSIITNKWGLYIDGADKHRLDGRLTINNGTTVYTDATNNIWLNVNGSIYFNNHALITSRGGDNSNVDHIWHDDATTDGAPGTWNFCSDVTYKAGGNSRLRAGQIDCGQTNGTSTFSGNLTVSGTKNFQIDHPVEALKDTHFLMHASVESPQLDLIYRGSSTLSNGSITIDIDEHFGMTAGTFVALNGDIQCFTTNETGWAAVRGKVENGVLTIECQDETSTDTISWMVVGRRIDEKTITTTTTDDQGKLILEVSKDSEIFSMRWDHELEGTTSGDGDDLINTRVRFK